MRRSLALLFAAATVSARALANPCGDPDFVDAYPADQATNVPTNATLSAHYAANAEYLNETVTLDHVGGDSETVAATFDDTQGLLQVTLPEPLVAGDAYVITWPALRGVDTATLGSSEAVHFTVGDGADTAAPTFDGLTHVSWDVRRERDTCTDDIENRFSFDLTPGTATDDFGTASLTLVVFQTKGPNIGATDPPLQVTVAPFPGNAGTVRVERSISDGTGNVCFAALVRDLTGNASPGADKEVCVKTTPPPFFYGCRLAPLSPGRTDAPLFAVGALALSLFGRRRYRRNS